MFGNIDGSWLTLRSPVSAPEAYNYAKRAEDVSGLPLRRIPTISESGSLDDFKMSATLDYRCDHNAHLGTTYPSGASGLAQSMPLAAAYYLRKNNEILIHPRLQAATSPFGVTWTMKSIVIHEMTHAIQAESFPEAFDRIDVARNKKIRIYEGLGWKTFFSSWRQLKKLDDECLPTSLLLEGHAVWVQTMAEKFDAPENTCLRMRKDTRIFSFKQISDFFWGTRPNAYVAGYSLVDAIYRLQEDMQNNPFLNDRGESVVLADDLRGHGLMRTMFQNIHLVSQVMPYLLTAWLPSNRAIIDITPLRKFVAGLPGHVSLPISN